VSRLFLIRLSASAALLSMLQGTIVTRRDIITIWFDGDGTMRQWEKARR